MENYAVLSLETHLFFARIMKEHGLFLEAGFPCADAAWMERADWFRRQFEDLLRDTVELSDGRVNPLILDSQELVTEFTIPAERRTERLSGVTIDSRISVAEQELHPGCPIRSDRELTGAVHGINRRALQLLDGFIDFKENILEEVGRCRLFTANYPLLIKHILREAKLYRATVQELLEDRELSYKNLTETEEFWNRIMMEHALFIRGLLDPSEVKLIETADQFATEYQELLERARRQDCKALGLTEETLAETLKYRDFKAAGAEGILDCKIASIILPLLADHVLREANHYIRLLQADSRE
ncbi:MAG: DUF2935 domain-containing protein [Lachnospiraceae bacterium]|nr:DUF2935 domain-containing protein [Lachnospiraceae bacterium]